MKTSELPHGEPSQLRLDWSSGLSTPALPDDLAEVTLHFPSGADQPLLRWPNGAAQTSPADSTTRQRLSALELRDAARILWIVDNDPAQKTVTVSVHQFARAISLGEKLAIAVDEIGVRAAQRVIGAAASIEQVCEWLRDEVQLPPLRPGGPARAIATGDPEGGRRFRLLGRRFAVDIDTSGATPAVIRIAPVRDHRRAFRPPEILIEAELSFKDSTATSDGVLRSIQAQLSQIIADSDNSYLALWQRYQDLERAQLLARAQEIGFIPYKGRSLRPTGVWRFSVSDKAGLATFYDRAVASDVQLEASPHPPAKLLDPLSEENLKRLTPPLSGRPTGARPDKRTLDLRPYDEDKTADPPEKGYLYCSLHGDKVRLRRREEALRRLKSAQAYIPRLALIIEGQPATVIKPLRHKPLCKVSRRVFKTEPTSAQRDAIDRALNTPDIALIQGPPGTGKTTVIAALEARLAELRDAGEEPSGRILLTSFQHDAVDNAVDRTRVYGLPPARFGGRTGDRTVEAQAERFAAELRTHLKAELSRQAEDRPLSLFCRVRDELAAVIAGGVGVKAALDLVALLLQQPAAVLPQPLWDRLLAAQATLKSDCAASAGDPLILKAIAGLRATPAAFSDDGPVRARRALSALGETLEEAEAALLERAGAVATGAPFEEQDEIAKLREALLDRHVREAPPSVPRGLPPGVLDTLKAAASHLREALETSPGGVGDALEELSEHLEEAPEEVIRTLRHYSAVYAATCQQAVGRSIASLKGLPENLWFNTVIVDEAARANPLDLFIPLSIAKRRVILVGDHRQLPHLLERSIEAELGADPQSAIAKALKESLFQRLFEDLKRRQLTDGINRVVTLDQQFRMHPVLGGFVSQTFYAEHNEGFSSPRPAADFHHPLKAWSRGGASICAGWKHIPKASGLERRVGHSFARRAEAQWIARHVHELVTGEGGGLTIGVIAFYSAQVTELLSAMAPLGLSERDADDQSLRIARHWRDLEHPDGSRVERLRVGTVDAFQGMEFDVVLLSAVRSNETRGNSPEAHRARFGHLMLSNRLCVAMSRQRKLLVVVGDSAMFGSEEGEQAVPGLARFHELCGGEHGLLA